ncbi:sterol desaturase family protein [Mucilaginibacter sp. L3T2-6]|uniref:sterol desaturase family protein n=1 Tax=Mucilaginibacter sp. L3T2-6 TaxID=3062491 RepID=UPI0026773B74|nr:sterol desaturase family protein [Mucilaginibacter sp. L3T2-6]MDO3640470.1 sterol desaturase family protein [Mucilaginibacter sp. L3T2-6]MDV6213191.1 sterol desaturase family protein [Mucilaginibacter sp. L3T2-6]
MENLLSYDTLKLLLNISSRYLVFTGSFYLLFYVWRKKRYWYAKIQQRYPDKKHIIREVTYSFFTVLIFGVIIMLTVIAGMKGLTPVYAPADKYGWFYYFFSILLMILMHDTYFYWTHRLMHWKPLFKWVHRVHHLSVNPTPFAAYAFHPVEAVIEVGIIPLIAFIIPHHATTIVIFGLYSLLMNVMGHLGYELFPKGFASHRFFKWHNTSTHHNMHHRLTRCNYGLYFNFWDRVMHTNHATYEDSYDKVVGQREQGKLIRQSLKTEAGEPVTFEAREKVLPEA